MTATIAGATWIDAIATDITTFAVATGVASTTTSPTRRVGPADVAGGGEGDTVIISSSIPVENLFPDDNPPALSVPAQAATGTTTVAGAVQMLAAANQIMQGLATQLPAPIDPSTVDITNAYNQTSVALAIAMNIVPFVQEQLEQTNQWASNFNSAGPLIDSIIAGTPSPAASVVLDALADGAALLSTMLSSAQGPLSDAVSAVDSATEAVATMSTSMSQTLASAQQDVSTLTAEISRAQSKLDSDHNAELSGCAGGILGYLFARWLGGLIDDEKGLNDEIANDGAKVQADQQLISTLTNLTGQTTTIQQSVELLNTLVPWLQSVWTAVSAYLRNIVNDLNDASQDPGFADTDLTAAIPDIQSMQTAVANALQRLGSTS